MTDPALRPVKLGISTCPNDTFIFDAWINGRLAVPGPPVDCVLEDISALNDMVFRGQLDVAKMSFFACAAVQGQYCLLDAGGALGRGCGPLLVARPGLLQAGPIPFDRITVAVPGQWTTANLLLQLYRPDIGGRVVLRFDAIMPAVAAGEVDAGVIIHEGRFVYPSYGLALVADLGQWWERETGCAIPLGCIVARRALSESVRHEVTGAIRRSLATARRDPEAALPFMRAHAQHMDAQVMREHVALYVNEFSAGYGADGWHAIEVLLERAAPLCAAATRP